MMVVMQAALKPQQPPAPGRRRMEKEAMEGVFAQVKHQSAREDPQGQQRRTPERCAQADCEHSEHQSGIAAMVPELAEHHCLQSNIDTVTVSQALSF
jgi:hypothetical protein